MWTFHKPVSLIRYLVVLRVNSGLVRLPACLAAELSLVLGTTIARRLPTREAQPWQKALSAWEGYGGVGVIGKKKPEAVPDAAWPVESVLLVYPGKKIYGEGEAILWELKLMGESADHALFLELILPALEEAGFAADTPWHSAYTLWGHYNIHAVYAARGPRWEPLVSDGKLDLRYRATPAQWAEDLPFEAAPAPRQRMLPPLKRLTWLTPFDLNPASIANNRPRKKAKMTLDEAPTLRGILEALVRRVSQLLPGRRAHHAADEAWEVLDPEAQFDLTYTLEQAAHIPVTHHAFEPAPKEWPGRWRGSQTFAAIPPAIVPYLQLASILHLGRQTHFGCGTFHLI